MSVRISPNLPANVVEIGDEISQAKIDEINAGTLATQTWVNSQGFLTSAVTSDKAMANAIASSIWYVYDTGTDYNRTGGIANVSVINGAGNIGVTDGTTTTTGLPSIITSLSTSAYWYVSVNGTNSDYIVSDATP